MEHPNNRVHIWSITAHRCWEGNRRSRESSDRMLTTLVGLFKQKTESWRIPYPCTDALQAAGQVVKHFGRAASLAFILQLEGPNDLYLCAHITEFYRDTPRMPELSIYTLAQTLTVQNVDIGYKIGLLKEKRVTAPRQTHKCCIHGRVSHHAARGPFPWGATSTCVPIMYRVEQMCLGGLLPYKVINVTSWVISVPRTCCHGTILLISDPG